MARAERGCFPAVSADAWRVARLIDSRLNVSLSLLPTLVANFSEGKSREYLFDLIRDVLKEEDPAEQRRKWENVHAYYHQEAVLLPFWGKRVPTLMNSRLTGYEAGMQQFDYPVNRLKPLT